MDIRISSGLHVWLALAISALALAGCQAGATDPAPNAAQQATSTRPVSTLTPSETAAEPAGTELQPTFAVAATAVPAESDSQDATQEVESPEPATPSGESGAANADVEYVRATQGADGSWRFEVTVRHPDTGWEDYADGWDVVTPDGQVLKVDESDPFTRLLLHPHENEQPFTRSQRGIVVPEGVTVVIVRAHDLLAGFGGREVRVDLMNDGGADFEVIRE